MWWSVVITICETNSAFTKSSSTGTTCRFDGTGFSINIFLLMSIRNIIFKMKVCIICHARWEIPFEFFSLRNYFELLIYCFIFWFSIWTGWWTGQKRWGWGRQPFPFFSPWPWLFFLCFCWSILLSPGLMKENFFSFSLTCVIKAFSLIPIMFFLW